MTVMIVTVYHVFIAAKPTPAPLAANPFADQQPPDPLLIPKPSINDMKQPPFVAPTQFVPPVTYTATPLAFAGGPSATPFTGGHLGNQSFGGMPPPAPPSSSHVVHDPWTPVAVSANSNGNAQLGAPWMKQEQANPFLS